MNLLKLIDYYKRWSKQICIYDLHIFLIISLISSFLSIKKRIGLSTTFFNKENNINNFNLWLWNLYKFKILWKLIMNYKSFCLIHLKVLWNISKKQIFNHFKFVNFKWFWDLSDKIKKINVFPLIINLSMLFNQ